jgi:hypothetical protein
MSARGWNVAPVSSIEDKREVRDMQAEKKIAGAQALPEARSQNLDQMTLLDQVQVLRTFARQTRQGAQNLTVASHRECVLRHADILDQQAAELERLSGELYASVTRTN